MEGSAQVGIQTMPRSIVRREPDRYDLAHELEKQIIAQRNRLTRDYFELGRLLHNFDTGGHWRYRADLDGNAFTSFDKWLRQTHDVSTTTCRNALQSYRQWILDFRVPLHELAQVDLSKYVEINPVARRLIKTRERDKEIIEREAVVREGHPGGDLAVVWYSALEDTTRASAREWIYKAQTMSRRELRAERGRLEGWRVESVTVSYDELPDKMKPLFENNGHEIDLTGKQPLDD